MTRGGKGTQEESETKGLRSWQVARDDRQRQLTRDSRETNRHEIGFSHREEDRSG